MAYIRKDTFYKKAKREGYNSRAVYKLVEIDDKYKLFEGAKYVLDLGAAPGSWSQALLKKLRYSGLVVAVDIIDVKNINNNNFIFIKGNIFDEDIITEIKERQTYFDVVVSDAAPNTTGDKTVDHYSSVELVRRIAYISQLLLKKGGNFLFKLFEGVETKDIVEKMKKDFIEVKIYRPKATRQSSFEIYVVCKGKI
jgi:23S rRNA (uridine2552-2'-O)-methyltransferase